MRVVVVGAGIAGLTAAWELQRSGGVDVTVLEAERRAGGVIVTEQVEGFIVEGGPDGFLAGEPELPALANELGIGDHIVSQQARGTARPSSIGSSAFPVHSAVPPARWLPMRSEEHTSEIPSRPPLLFRLLL